MKKYDPNNPPKKKEQKLSEYIQDARNQTELRKYNINLGRSGDQLFFKNEITKEGIYLDPDVRTKLKIL